MTGLSETHAAGMVSFGYGGESRCDRLWLGRFAEAANTNSRIPCEHLHEVRGWHKASQTLAVYVLGPLGNGLFDSETDRDG